MPRILKILLLAYIIVAAAACAAGYKTVFTAMACFFVFAIVVFLFVSVAKHLKNILVHECSQCHILYSEVYICSNGKCIYCNNPNNPNNHTNDKQHEKPAL